jgi:hypothetical protein
VLEQTLSYLVAAMMAWCPPSMHRPTQSPRLTVEEQDAHTLQRYKSIGRDLLEVAMEPETEVMLDGTMGRIKSAVLVLAIASYESKGFREDIDNVRGTGDQGRSHCLMQIMMRPGEVMKDRKDCFRLGFSRIKESFMACPRNREDYKLAVYASGKCHVGLWDSQMKISRFKNWFTNNPVIIE